MSADLDLILSLIAQRTNQTVQSIARQVVLDPFTYLIYIATVTLSATTTAQFTVQADSDFAICETTYLVTDTSNAAVSGLQPFGSGALTSLTPFLIDLTDSGAGRQMSDDSVPIDSWFGTAILPRRWGIPKILDRNSTFTVAVENLSGTDRRLRLAFSGVKIFWRTTNRS